MPRIYVLSGPDLGRTFDVAAGATFGRTAECAVFLRDASVSRAHARLERTAAGWRVVDVGSRNGLFVARARVASTDLADGDEFQLGEVLLRFRDETAAPSQRREAPRAPEPSVTPAPEIHFRPLGPSTRGGGTGADAVGEIELEGDWSAPTSSPRASPPQSPAPPPPPRAAPAPGARSAPIAAARSSEGRGVLQFNRVEQREGLLKQDLEQQPTWVRVAAVLLLVAGAAALAWLAYQAATATKARIVPPDAAAEEQ